MVDRSSPDRLRFHGGSVGAVAPVLVFVTGVAWLALSGAPNERGFWPILLAALSLGLLLARDRGRYAEVIIAGMSQPIVMLMVMAWLLAGVLGALLGASGLVESLVWLAHATRLTGGGFVAAAFLVCCVVSTSTGTSLGTVVVCAPLLYPASGALGADPAFLIGAILAGATFGDNLSPMSDTTIASAGTQEADLGGVVRSRLKYALPAGGVALLLYALLGGSAGAAGNPSPGLEAGPAGLPMLAVPAVVVALLLGGRHLLEGLLSGIVLATLLGLALGAIEPSQLLLIDPERFGAEGLVVDGVERGVGVSVFTLFLVALVSALEASGVLEDLVGVARGRAVGPRGAEVWIVATVSVAVLLTTHSVVALLAVGRFARDTGARVGLGPYRRANLLDSTVCTYPFLLPYCIPTILAAGTTETGAAFGVPRITALAAGAHNLYSWLLLVVIAIAIVTGYGRAEPGPRSRAGARALEPERRA